MWPGWFVAQDMKLRKVAYKMTRQALKIHFNLCEEHLNVHHSSSTIFFLFPARTHSLTHINSCLGQGWLADGFAWYAELRCGQLQCCGQFPIISEGKRCQSVLTGSRVLCCPFWMRSKPKRKISTAVGYGRVLARQLEVWNNVNGKLEARSLTKRSVPRCLWVCKEQWCLCFMLIK